MPRSSDHLATQQGGGGGGSLVLSHPIHGADCGCSSFLFHFPSPSLVRVRLAIECVPDQDAPCTRHGRVRLKSECCSAQKKIPPKNGSVAFYGAASSLWSFLSSARKLGSFPSEEPLYNSIRLSSGPPFIFKLFLVFVLQRQRARTTPKVPSSLFLSGTHRKWGLQNNNNNNNNNNINNNINNQKQKKGEESAPKMGIVT